MIRGHREATGSLHSVQRIFSRFLFSCISVFFFSFNVAISRAILDYPAIFSQHKSVGPTLPYRKLSGIQVVYNCCYRSPTLPKSKLKGIQWVYSQ